MFNNKKNGIVLIEMLSLLTYDNDFNDDLESLYCFLKLSRANKILEYIDNNFIVAKGIIEDLGIYRRYLVMKVRFFIEQKHYYLSIGLSESMALEKAINDVLIFLSKDLVLIQNLIGSCEKDLK